MTLALVHKSLSELQVENGHNCQRLIRSLLTDSFVVDGDGDGHWYDVEADSEYA